MSIGFGPMPGPRQTTSSEVQDSRQATAFMASIKFKTSRTVLQNLFPPNSGSFRFKSPGTVTYASFSMTTLDRMEWLGGSGYNHIGLYIHGVEYVKNDGNIINGTYIPFLFESLTDPIVSGREEIGMPKLFSSIDTFRGSDSFRINTSWKGAQWGNFSLHGLVEVDIYQEKPTISGEANDGILIYRYIPKVGRDNKGVAEAEYSVFVPFNGDNATPKPKREFNASKASFQVDALSTDTVPTLHHVTSRRAELPMIEIVAGRLVESEGVPAVSQAHRLEWNEDLEDTFLLFTPSHRHEVCTESGPP